MTALADHDGQAVDRDVSRYQIGVVLVRAISNRLDARLPLVPQILEALQRSTTATSGEVAPNK